MGAERGLFLPVLLQERQPKFHKNKNRKAYSKGLLFPNLLDAVTGNRKTLDKRGSHYLSKDLPLP